jgi:hypothetical protein
MPRTTKQYAWQCSECQLKAKVGSFDVPVQVGRRCLEDPVTVIVLAMAILNSLPRWTPRPRAPPVKGDGPPSRRHRTSWSAPPTATRL